MITRRGLLRGALATLAALPVAKAGLLVATQEPITATEVILRGMTFHQSYRRFDVPGAPWMHYWTTNIKGRMYDFALVSDQELPTLDESHAAYVAFERATKRALLASDRA